MKNIALFLFLTFSLHSFSQSPSSIPYQAVLRSSDGFVMANSSATITFKIHDSTASGVVVYEETHTTTSNAQGLISLNLGAGTTVTGTFSSINWGGGAKFLNVFMNAGNGIVDLGKKR